jgi:hypothetical protein
MNENGKQCLVKAEVGIARNINGARGVLLKQNQKEGVVQVRVDAFGRGGEFSVTVPLDNIYTLDGQDVRNGVTYPVFRNIVSGLSYIPS